MGGGWVVKPGGAIRSCAVETINHNHTASNQPNARNAAHVCGAHNEFFGGFSGLVCGWVYIYVYFFVSPPNVSPSTMFAVHLCRSRGVRNELALGRKYILITLSVNAHHFRGH